MPDIIDINLLDGKVASDPANYRDISLISVLSKLFEKVLYPYIADILTPLLHLLQGGFRQGFSSLHTSLILQEGIAECKACHHKAYLAFLDVKKAFDTVWHDGLFFKLMQAGISPSIWKTLFYWYSHLVSAVSWDSITSQYFPVKQGICQGAVLSPILYSLYVNDLLIQLELLNVGLFINSLYVGAPTYVDDACLISDNSINLQHMSTAQQPGNKALTEFIFNVEMNVGRQILTSWSMSLLENVDPRKLNLISNYILSTQGNRSGGGKEASKSNSLSKNFFDTLKQKGSQTNIKDEKGT
uniref:Reverse transcriptase domain-containing protein n=1 Tax=Amphimedon queenslandica TaxID=400682 RepID=A0A1X7TXX3_AMPQE